MAQTDGQTDGHGESVTESAEWGQFSEQCILHTKLHTTHYTLNLLYT